MLKAVVLLNVFVEILINCFQWGIKSSKEQQLFEIKKVFSVTFEQFNGSLLNRIINFFKKKVLTTNF